MDIFQCSNKSMIHDPSPRKATLNRCCRGLLYISGCSRRRRMLVVYYAASPAGSTCRDDEDDDDDDEEEARFFFSVGQSRRKFFRRLPNQRCDGGDCFCGLCITRSAQRTDSSGRPFHPPRYKNYPFSPRQR